MLWLKTKETDLTHQHPSQREDELNSTPVLPILQSRTIHTGEDELSSAQCSAVAVASQGRVFCAAVFVGMFMSAS